MGRYITGDFSWKFAFGDQSSSFGEVIEYICTDLEDNYVNRYIGTQEQGEIVELNVENAKELLKPCKEYVGKGFKVKNTENWCKCKEKFGDSYWNKLMIRKFIKERDSFKGDEGETLNFYVEY